MKTINKRKSGFLFALIAVAALLAVIAAFGFGGSGTTAHAETYGSEGDYTFTLVTDSEGNSSYKAAIKTTLRNTATVAIVPDTYNGLPVTELANNAFMSCKKLTKVVLPKSVTKIGTSAFLNCTQLEVVHMPGVVEIGATAFSSCTTLDRLYIPKTVKKVGANILRNNPNTVFVQSAAEELGEGWSSTWNNYHTGEVVYSATAEYAIGYRPIHNESDTAVIGYEVYDAQQLNMPDEDVVIYNAYRPDESSEYLPVYNICSGAFYDTKFKSLTIKDRPEDDEDFPVFDHKINIRSSAFVMADIGEIIIESDVTFDHPADLQVGPDYNDDGLVFEGGADGHSVGVFEYSDVHSITLPSTLTAVYDKMFYACTWLTSIKIEGQEYDGINRLPDVTSIGDEAFFGCGYLQNLEIPSTVTSMGNDVFSLWGTGVDEETYEEITQYINIQIFEKKLPAGWSEEWRDCIGDNVVVTFKEIIVAIDLCDGEGGYITVSVVPDEIMPDIDIPEYIGHSFNGVFTEYSGKGMQYYTSLGECVREWHEGDPTVLYADWDETIYEVLLQREDEEPYYVYPRFNNPMPAASMPTKRGYSFQGYYYLESDGTKTFYYNDDMSSASDWNRDENCTLHPEWIIIEYTITYNNLNDGENPAENPTKYTVESPTIQFAKPYGRVGYYGSWNITEIPSGSVGPVTVIASWTAVDYDIKYENLLDGENPNEQIKKYTIEDTINLAPPFGRKHYVGSWDIMTIPKGSTGDITITAVWTLQQYKITYAGVSGLTNFNPKTVTWEDEIELEYVSRSGYSFLGWKFNGRYVTELSDIENDITLTAVWSNGKTANLEAGMIDVYISVNDSTVVLPSTNFTSAYGCTINFISYVPTVTITSNTDVVYKMNIVISAGGFEPSLYLNKVSMQSAKPSTPTIDVSGYTLNLYTTGTCAIYGYDGQPRSSSISANNGSYAIHCYRLAIYKADDLTIRGGNGSSASAYAYGVHGANGFNAVYATGSISVATKNVKLIGGNGGNGKAGANSYGYGAEATNVKPTGSYTPTTTKGSNGYGEG